MREVILIIATIMIGIGMMAFLYVYVRESVKEMGLENTKLLRVVQYPLYLMLIAFTVATVLKIKGII